jgi:hemoglobin-like flavoprotein
MTPEQVALVKNSWAQVVPIKETAADLFYNKLFELDPAVQPLFKSDLAEQKRKLVSMLNSVVNGLDNIAALIPVAQDLGKRHVPYGVKAEHYDTVGAALLWTLSAGLGDGFTPAVKEAWTTAYTTLAGVMKKAAYA